MFFGLRCNAHTLSFQDALALIRLDELFLESFDVTDGKTAPALCFCLALNFCIYVTCFFGCYCKMNSMSKLCLFNCTSGIFCLCSETSEGRPLIQSHWKNSGEGRKNQIHHWKCHKDSHCACRHVSAPRLSCYTTWKKCICLFGSFEHFLLSRTAETTPKQMYRVQNVICFELDLFFSTFQHRRLIYSFKNVLIHNCFFLTCVTVSTKTKNGIVLNAVTTEL